MLTGLIGVATFIADIIVAGATQDEFLKRLFFVFKRIQQYGFHVGGRKMPIFWTSIKYLDSIFDKNCRQLNRKIFLHQNTSAKADISTLRSFLVMVIHYRSFCENPSVFEFPWIAFWKRVKLVNRLPKIKSLLSSDFLLTHYNPLFDIIDTRWTKQWSNSEWSLDNCLYHKQIPNMLYGHYFSLVTDHKRLVSLLGSKKAIPIYTSNRLQQ